MFYYVLKNLYKRLKEVLIMSEDILEQIRRQNEVIISLLGRLVFDENSVRNIVTYNKREELKTKYIEGYNSCDGKKTQKEIADIIGISQSTLSPIINEWVEIGIIYEIHRGNRKYYKKLFPIQVK